MDGYPELAAVLARVRRRWQAMRLFHALRKGGAAACGVLLCALAAHRLLQPSGLTLILLWATAAALVLAAASAPVASLASRPRDLQIARLIEERCDDLDDSLVTAVATAGSPDATPMSAVFSAGGRMDTVWR